MPTPEQEQEQEQEQANEAVLALIALGYKQVEAHKAVCEVQQGKNRRGDRGRPR